MLARFVTIYNNLIHEEGAAMVGSYIKPNSVEAHEIVLAAPFAVVHEIGIYGNWQVTRCGIAVRDGVLETAFQAILDDALWCRKCW